MTLLLASVVEGQTEQNCLEPLLQRTWTGLLQQHDRIQILEPCRENRGKLIHPNGVALVVKAKIAYRMLQVISQREPDATKLLLLLIDAESDCPATLAPRLLEIVRNSLPPDTDITCVLPNQMFENWIVAGASTLAGINGLPSTIPARDRVEELNGASWLEKQLRSIDNTRKYKKTEDAFHYVRSMNLVECRANSPSFDKLCRELEKRIHKPLPEATEHHDEQTA